MAKARHAAKETRKPAQAQTLGSSRLTAPPEPLGAWRGLPALVA